MIYLPIFVLILCLIGILITEQIFPLNLNLGLLNLAMEIPDNWLKNWHPYKPDPEEEKNNAKSGEKKSKEEHPKEQSPEEEPFNDKPVKGSFEDKYGVII
jgi:hypothetical protein